MAVFLWLSMEAGFELLLLFKLDRNDGKGLVNNLLVVIHLLHQLFIVIYEGLKFILEQAHNTLFTEDACCLELILTLDQV